MFRIHGVNNKKVKFCFSNKIQGEIFFIYTTNFQNRLKKNTKKFFFLLHFRNFPCFTLKPEFLVSSILSIPLVILRIPQLSLALLSSLKGSTPSKKDSDAQKGRFLLAHHIFLLDNLFIQINIEFAFEVGEICLREY